MYKSIHKYRNYKLFIGFFAIHNDLKKNSGRDIEICKRKSIGMGQNIDYHIVVNIL